MNDDAHDYVTREEFERLHPRGAKMDACVFCRQLLIVPSNSLPDCGAHVIQNGEFV